ncbi:hypothetical protein BKA56DRAFT_470371 [Ilyonectria sp. MPI-CAGE-AT-0026]|nr:hypothetical protein BKA56DRAFT_470371 [Ilyonectria sp. MPI-CAGE-AT-0026]
MGNLRTRPNISVYPLIPWYIVKISQTTSACIVFIIMLELVGNRSTPTTLYFIQGAALVTIIGNLAIGVWINRRGIIPKMSAIVNTVFTILWAAGYGLLLSSLASVITVPCTITYFITNRGVRSCQFYKVLVAFGATGLVSTMAMAILDILAARKIKQGKVIVADHERLLVGTAAQTSYRRVSDEERELSTMTPAGLEPTRHEQAMMR